MHSFHQKYFMKYPDAFHLNISAQTISLIQWQSSCIEDRQLLLSINEEHLIRVYAVDQTFMPSSSASARIPSSSKSLYCVFYKGRGQNLQIKKRK